MNPAIKNIYEFYTPFAFREALYSATKLKYYQNTIDTEYQDPILKSFNKYRCIFIHVPKTGGMSIRDSLFAKSSFPPHLSLHNFQTLFGESRFKSYYKFAFVRNPWDRVVSAFFYLKTNRSVQRNRKWDKYLSKYESFDNFVKNWITPRNIQKHVVLIPQYKFLIDHQGNLGVDCIASFENFNSDFARIQKQIGSEVKLKHINKSRRTAYQDYYTEESRKIIADIYARDIAQFKYNFE